MDKKTFQAAFDAVPFSTDFKARTTARLLGEQELARKPGAFRTKKGKLLLIAAALAAVIAATAGTIRYFAMPEEAQEFLQLRDSHLAQILSDGSVEGVDGVRIEKGSVKTAGQTVSLEGVLDGLAIRPDIGSMLKVMNSGDSGLLEFSIKKEIWAVLTVTADDGGPVLGAADETELHHNMGCGLFVQGIDPIMWHFAGQFIVVDNVAYLFVPLHDAMMYADRELRICVYGDFAPGWNMLTLDGSTGLAKFKSNYNGIQATFTVDLDDGFANPHAVTVFEEKQPNLPTAWEKRHGLAD